MADNEEVNKFTTELDVKEAQGLRNKIGRFGKNLKNNIPENITTNILYRTNSKDLDFAGKTLRQATKQWNKFQKQAAGGIFGDKRQAQDVNNFFGKLKMALIESKLIYQDQLKQLGDANNLDNTMYGKLSEKLQLSNDRGKELEQTLQRLTAERDKLAAKQGKYELLPQVKDIKRQENVIQKTMTRLRQSINKRQLKAFNNETVQQDIRSSMQDAMARFDYSAQMAQSIKNFGALTTDSEGKTSITKDSSLWDKMVTRVQNMKQSLQSQSDLLNNSLGTLMSTETELEQNLQDALDRFVKKKEDKYKLEVEDITRQLDSVRSDIERTSNELDKVNINQELVEGYQKSLDNAERTRGMQYHRRLYGKGLYMDAMHNYAMAGDKETTMMNKVTASTPTMGINNQIKQYQELDRMLSAYQKVERSVNRQNRNRDKNDEQIRNLDQQIKDTEKAIQNNTEATKQFSLAMEEVNKKVKEIRENLEKLNSDLQLNPVRDVLQSDALKQFNANGQELTRKWGPLTGIFDRIKASLAGIKGYMKQTTPWVKVWHKVWVNIYSQIATLINPLNVFKRAWNGWLNEWQNMAWKNTFDVITYNLIRVVAPFLEWCATMLIKFTAILNVFTKKYANIDLFDKSAWQLDKIMKGVGQLTASFDELHSTTDNPDIFNTIFDSKLLDTQDILKDMDLSKWENAAKKLQPIIFGIGNALKWCVDNWQILATALIGFKIGQGLFKLTNWLGLFEDGVKNVSGLLGGSSGLLSKISTLGMFAGGTLFLYEAISLAKDWNFLSNEEKQLKMKVQNIGSEILGASAGYKIGTHFGNGIVGGITGFLAGRGLSQALNSVQYITHGMEKEGIEEGTKAGANIGGAIGLAIGSSFGPLGSALGYTIGNLVGGLSGKAFASLGASFVSSGLYANLKTSTEDLEKATNLLKEAQDKEVKSLEDLKRAEQETGISADIVNKRIEKGYLTYDNLTVSQKKVYDAYKKHQEALNELKEAQKLQMDISTKLDLDNAKKSNNYEGYINKMMQANKEGIYSNEELQDRLSQVYASLDTKSRQVFLQSIPENMRKGVEDGAQKYYSGWEKTKNAIFQSLNKFGSDWKNFWDTLWGNVIQGISDFGEKLKNALSFKGFNTNAQLQEKAEYKAKLQQLENWKQQNQNSTSWTKDMANFYDNYKKQLQTKINSYAVGTNYVPNDQLAYIHRGEAIIPSKYNKPYQPENNGMNEVISEMTREIGELRALLQQGINVKGEFKQRGSDLVATVDKARNKNGNQILNNPIYAR